VRIIRNIGCAVWNCITSYGYQDADAFPAFNEFAFRNVGCVKRWAIDRREYKFHQITHKDIVVSSETISQPRKVRVFLISETPSRYVRTHLKRRLSMTCSEYSLEFLRPLFLLFPCMYQFISFSFHCLCHCLLVSRSLPLPLMGFGPFSPFTSRLSSTSSNFHWTRITCWNLQLHCCCP